MCPENEEHLFRRTGGSLGLWLPDSVYDGKDVLNGGALAMSVAVYGDSIVCFWQPCVKYEF